MDHLPETPFFIVGNPRSGTTLLRFILSSHSRIYVPGETGFLPFLKVQPGEQLTQDKLKALLQQIGRLNKNWDGLVEDIPAFSAALPEVTVQYVIDALYRRVIAQYDSGAVRWGDKTPTYVCHMPRLHELFPTAQFVHLIRDGRDAALSAMEKWGRRRWYMDMYYLLRNWERNVNAGRNYGCTSGGDRYHELHYEDLVRDPERVLSRLCVFLGETLEPAMLEHTTLARRHIGPGGHVEVRRPISTTRVARWRHAMSPFERKVAHRIAGPTLERFGYEPGEAARISAVENLRLLALSAKYRAVTASRTALTGLGLLTLNRGKRR